MASEVDICNLALAHLGDNATVASIDPPEGSAQAEHCALFYPIARDALLEQHAWKFATKRVLLASLDAPTWEWAYAYAQPSDALRLLAVLPESSSSDEAQEYEAETDSDGRAILLTNQQAANLRYIARVTDTTAFSPLFVNALSWLLAAHLAGPVIKGDAGAAMAKTCMQNYALALSTARVSDANQHRRRPEHSPSWIEGR
jgi:hypothetical protein